MFEGKKSRVDEIHHQKNPVFNRNYETRKIRKSKLHRGDVTGAPDVHERLGCELNR